MPTVWYLLGASGSGKSTRARQLASQIDGPVHIVSTDVVRSQLRAVLDRTHQPELWAESFDVPMSVGDEELALEGVNIAGFLRQCEPVLRCVEAAVDYCLGEGWSCIVEGVHLVPGEFSMSTLPGVEVHAELLRVESEVEHRARFTQRDIASGGGRPADHYNRNLPAIRNVQRFLDQRWQAFGPPTRDALEP